MKNKKQIQFKLRYLALKKENRRLVNKILTLEAKIVTLQSELELRPAFSLPRRRASAAGFIRRLRTAARVSKESSAAG